MRKNESEKETRKPLKKKSRVIIAISITLGCVIVGGVGGYFVGNMVFRSQNAIDYSKMNIADFEDDTESLMKKYSSAKTSDYSITFQPYELACIAIEKVKGHDYVMAQTYGEVDAMGVNQTVRATSIKNKDEYFMENISASSMVKTAFRFYQSESKVTTYEGSNVETDKAEWKTKPYSELTTTEHEEKWGKDLSRSIIYIISSKTCFDTSKAEKTDSGYTVRLDLSPKYSVLRYVRQMLSISPIKDPIFHSVQFNLYLDKDLNLLSTEVNESYSVVMVVTAESVAHLKEYYTYDVQMNIPALNQNLEYSKGE